MSGPDIATRADGIDEEARRRVETFHALSPWWRVVDAEILWPAVNAAASVDGLYDREGAKR